MTTRSTPSRVARLSWWVMAVVIGAGATLGFLTTRSQPTGANLAEDATVTTLVRRSSQAPVRYEWTEVELPGGFLMTTAELDGSLFVLLDTDGSDRALWTSEAGDTWREIDLELGPDVRITDVDVDQDSLILSGSVAGAPTLWMSVPGRSIDGMSWLVVALELAGAELGPILADRTTTVTAVNDEGEVFTNAIVERDVSGSLSTQAVDGQAPELEVSAGRIWVRQIDNNGDPVLQTLEIPAGANATDYENGNLDQFNFWSSWVSRDGIEFDMVVGETRLPNPPFAFGYRSNFLTKASDRDNVGLWQTASGQGWVDTTWQPPPECGGWDTVAVSGKRMLLISPLRSTACVSDNGADWELVPTGLSPAPQGPSRPVIGGPSGFLILTADTTDWLVSSRDGITWETIEAPASKLTPLVQFVGDHVLATGIADPSGDPTWWLGTPTGNP